MGFTSKAKKEQIEYVAGVGGWMNIFEADDRFNNYSRKTILEYKKEFDTAVIGNINGNAEEVEFRKIVEDQLYNFCCDFVLPKPDDTLARLLNEWRDTGEYKTLTELTNRITELGGELILWT